MTQRLPLTRRQCLALTGLALVSAQGRAQAAPAPGQSAPDFALRSVDGQNLRLREQRGHVVMLNF
jgi:hypothetical protein